MARVAREVVEKAGIDVGNGVHYVAVRPDRDPQPVRRFECFTADLHRLADWLRSCGVKTVAMQSTGVYWIPIYEILEERGIQVYLVNARHTKNLPGRKSDVQESQWLLKLHTYGLLNNSFQPPSEIRVLRTYWRQRGEHVRGAATCVQRTPSRTLFSIRPRSPPGRAGRLRCWQSGRIRAACLWASRCRIRFREDTPRRLCRTGC